MHASQFGARLAAMLMAVAVLLLVAVGTALAAESSDAVYGNGDVDSGQQVKVVDDGGAEPGAAPVRAVEGDALLAETGSDTGQIALVAVGALALGGVTLIAARRRNRQDTSQ